MVREEAIALHRMLHSSYCILKHLWWQAGALQVFVEAGPPVQLLAGRPAIDVMIIDTHVAETTTKALQLAAATAGIAVRNEKWMQEARSSSRSQGHAVWLQIVC